MESRIVTCPSCQARNRVPAASTGKPICASCKAGLPWIVDATDSTLVKALDTKALVVIDLWAPWCGPCRMVAPVLERIAERHSGLVKVVKINVDENPLAARTYDASSIPTLVLVRNGAVVDRVIGAQPEPALDARIRPFLTSD